MVDCFCRSSGRNASVGSGCPTDISKPFWFPTVVAIENSVSVVWRELQSAMRSDELIIAQCRTKPDTCGSPAGLRFIAIVKEAREYEGFARIGHINRAVNLSIKAKSSGDKWPSPLTALTSEIGDCKSYVIIQFTALNDAGIAADDLRIIIVHIRSHDDDHAVVAARNAGHWLIIDNRRMTLVESRYLPDYEPLFTLDYRGVREFVVPGPKVASVPCIKVLG